MQQNIEDTKYSTTVELHGKKNNSTSLQLEFEVCNFKCLIKTALLSIESNKNITLKNSVVSEAKQPNVEISFHDFLMNIH